MKNAPTIIEENKNLPEEVTKLINESGLEHTKAQAYISAFVPYLNKLSELEEQIKDIPTENITPEIAKQARALRLQYVPNRTAAEKEKDILKKSILVESNLIQSMYNVVLNASKMKEDHLKGIEEHSERIEAAAKAKIKAERETLLSPYVDNVTIYPLGEIDEEAFKQLLEGQKLIKEKKEKEVQLAIIKMDRINLLAQFPADITNKIVSSITMDIALLTPSDFNQLLESARAAHEEVLENKRIEDKRIQKENELLKKENEAKEKLLLEANKKAKEEADKQAKILAEQKRVAEEKASKLKAEQDALLKKEREAKEKLEKELADKKAADLKAEADKQASIEAELAKGDKAKIDSLVSDLDALKTKYVFKSKKHKALYASISELIDKTITYAVSKN